MIDWRVKQTVCGISELTEHERADITHMLSILDPDVDDPGFPAPIAAGQRLMLRFHDIILPQPDMTMPTRGDVEQVLAFGRTLPDNDPAHLLIHCHMGISRSTAAATALLLQARPGLSDDDALAQIHSIRPVAWPNSLMIGFADELLGRGGKLTAAVGRLYRTQLEANARFAEPLRAAGRGAELEMAAAAA